MEKSSKAKTSSSLDSKIQRLRSNTTNHTKKLLRRKIRKDSDVSLEWLTVSLLCPLSQRRMVLPCRSTKCSHLQCFDGITFLTMNERWNLKCWKCPVCFTKITEESLIVDKQFLYHVQQRPPDVQEVQIYTGQPSSNSKRRHAERRKYKDSFTSQGKSSFHDVPSKRLCLQDTVICISDDDNPEKNEDSNKEKNVSQVLYTGGNDESTCKPAPRKSQGNPLSVSRKSPKTLPRRNKSAEHRKSKSAAHTSNTQCPQRKETAKGHKASCNQVPALHSNSAQSKADYSSRPATIQNMTEGNISCRMYDSSPKSTFSTSITSCINTLSSTSAKCSTSSSTSTRCSSTIFSTTPGTNTIFSTTTGTSTKSSYQSVAMSSTTSSTTSSTKFRTTCSTSTTLQASSTVNTTSSNTLSSGTIFRTTSDTTTSNTTSCSSIIFSTPSDTKSSTSFDTSTTSCIAVVSKSDMESGTYSVVSDAYHVSSMTSLPTAKAKSTSNLDQTCTSNIQSKDNGQGRKSTTSKNGQRSGGSYKVLAGKEHNNLPCYTQKFCHLEADLTPRQQAMVAASVEILSNMARELKHSDEPNTSFVESNELCSVTHNWTASERDEKYLEEGNVSLQKNIQSTSSNSHDIGSAQENCTTKKRIPGGLEKSFQRGNMSGCSQIQSDEILKSEFSSSKLASNACSSKSDPDWENLAAYKDASAAAEGSLGRKTKVTKLSPMNRLRRNFSRSLKQKQNWIRSALKRAKAELEDNCIRETKSDKYDFSDNLPDIESPTNEILLEERGEKESACASSERTISPKEKGIDNRKGVTEMETLFNRKISNRNEESLQNCAMDQHFNLMNKTEHAISEDDLVMGMESSTVLQMEQSQQPVNVKFVSRPKQRKVENTTTNQPTKSSQTQISKRQTAAPKSGTMQNTAIKKSSSTCSSVADTLWVQETQLPLQNTRQQSEILLQLMMAQKTMPSLQQLEQQAVMQTFAEQQKATIQNSIEEPSAVKHEPVVSKPMQSSVSTIQCLGSLQQQSSHSSVQKQKSPQQLETTDKKDTVHISKTTEPKDLKTEKINSATTQNSVQHNDEYRKLVAILFPVSKYCSLLKSNRMAQISECNSILESLLTEENKQPLYCHVEEVTASSERFSLGQDSIRRLKPIVPVISSGSDRSTLCQSNKSALYLSDRAVGSQPDRLSSPQPNRPTLSQPNKSKLTQPNRHTASQPIKHTFPQPNRPTSSQPIRPSLSQPNRPSLSQPNRHTASQQIRCTLPQPTRPILSQSSRSTLSQPIRPALSQQQGPSREPSSPLPAHMNNKLFQLECRNIKPEILNKEGPQHKTYSSEKLKGTWVFIPDLSIKENLNMSASQHISGLQTRNSGGTNDSGKSKHLVLVSLPREQVCKPQQQSNTFASSPALAHWNSSPNLMYQAAPLQIRSMDQSRPQIVSPLQTTSLSQPQPQVISPQQNSILCQPQPQVISPKQNNVLGQPQPQMVSTWQSNSLGQPQPLVVSVQQSNSQGQPQPLVVSVHQNNAQHHSQTHLSAGNMSSHAFNPMISEPAQVPTLTCQHSTLQSPVYTDATKGLNKMRTYRRVTPTCQPTTVISAGIPRGAVQSSTVANVANSLRPQIFINLSAARQTGLNLRVSDSVTSTELCRSGIMGSSDRSTAFTTCQSTTLSTCKLTTCAYANNLYNLRSSVSSNSVDVHQHNKPTMVQQYQQVNMNATSTAFQPINMSIRNK